MITGRKENLNYKDLNPNNKVEYVLNPHIDENYISANYIAGSDNVWLLFHDDPLNDDHLFLYSPIMTINSTEFRNWQKSLILFFAKELRSNLIFFSNNKNFLHCFPASPLSIRERSTLVTLVDSKHNKTSAYLIDDFLEPFPKNTFSIQYNLSPPIMVKYLFNVNIKFYIEQFILPFSPIESRGLDDDLFRESYDWTTILNK